MLESYEVALQGWSQLQPNSGFASALLHSLTQMQNIDKVSHCNNMKAAYHQKPTRIIVQESAAKRVIGRPNIIEAAKTGDSKLIIDHTISNPASVHERDQIKYRFCRRIYSRFETFLCLCFGVAGRQDALIHELVTTRR